MIHRSSTDARGCRRDVTASQCGITLIEILVAIVVLSIGLLGLAGLQLKGMQVNQGSTYRSQAAILALEAAERLRADSQGAQLGNYNFATGTPPPAALTEWWGRVTALPGGGGSIIWDATAPANTVLRVTVTWVDTRAQSGAGVSSGSPAFTTPGSFYVPVEL